jgi:hypothetical protein
MRGLTTIEHSALLKCSGCTTINDDSGQIVNSDRLDEKEFSTIPLLIAQGRVIKIEYVGNDVYQITAQGKAALHYDEQSKRTFSFT